MAGWNTRARIAYWSPATRPRFAWPGGRKLAVWIVPNLEYYEYLPRRYDFRDQFARIMHPDVMQWSYRDYGNRVGVWRMADALAEYPVRVTASTNLAVFDHCPEVAALVRDRGWEVMSHGLYNTRYLGRESAEEEATGLREQIAMTREHTGQTLRGMLGPCVTNSPATMDLMAEHGLVYHADWVHDDIPVPIKAAGPLVSVPYNYDINDGPALEGHYDGAYLMDVCIRQFDRLRAEAGDGNGLVYCLPLHTYLIGQPHTIGYLRRILDHVCKFPDVWFATGGEIADAALAQLGPRR